MTVPPEEGGPAGNAMEDACVALFEAISALRREIRELREEFDVQTTLARIQTGIEESNREIARQTRVFIITLKAFALIAAFAAGGVVEAETGIISATVPPPPPDEARLPVETTQHALRQRQGAAEPRSEAARHLAVEESLQDSAIGAPVVQSRIDPVPSRPPDSEPPGYSTFPVEIMAPPPVMDPPPPPVHLAMLESRMTATLHRALWWQAAGIVAAIAALAGIAIGLPRFARDWLFPLPKPPDVP